MDKDKKEALQVTKELVAKFIETRNVSPSNITEIFPAIYEVVLKTITKAHNVLDHSQGHIQQGQGQHTKDSACKK